MTEPPAHAPAFISAPPRRVLFLCVHNSARSQIAEGFAHALAPADAEIWSAGSEPGTVNPLAVEVMGEAGIDITAQRAKHLDDVPWAEADTVVTLCGEANDVCPPLPANVRRVHWPLPDPTAVSGARQAEAFREARDEIRWRVASLWPQGD